MKRLTQKQLVSLTNTHGAVVLIVKLLGKKNRVRLLNINGECRWKKPRYDKYMQWSCFVSDSKSVFRTVSNMYEYDRESHLKIARVLTVDGKTLWKETK